MNAEQLFLCMDGIEDELLQRSEKLTSNKYILKRILPVAACVGVIVALLLIWKPLFGKKNVEILKTTPHNWNAVYNTQELVIPDMMISMPGSFLEVFDQERIDMIIPDKRMEWMTYSGAGRYWKDGSIICATIVVTTRNNEIYVNMGDHRSCEPFLIPTEDVAISVCGDMEYALYRYVKEPNAFHKRIERVAAVAVINDVPFLFNMTIKDPEQDIADFEAVLACFACYEDEKPDFYSMKPEEIPE